MIFNQLSGSYSQFENLIASIQQSEEGIDEKLSKLAIEIKNNGDNIQYELHKNPNLFSLFQRIGQIELKKSKPAKNVCALLELKVLLRGNDTQAVADWVLKNKEGISSEYPSELFENLIDARKQLTHANLLTPEVGNALSDIVTFALGLKGQKNATAVKTAIVSILNQNSLEALAHWINAEKIPLNNAGLQISELEAIAPYLHFVDFTGLELNDPETFISLCSNAYRLYIHSNKLKKLTKLPSQLQMLDISYSRNITTLDISQTPHLQTLSLSGCPISNLDLLHTPNLKSLSIGSCPLSKLDLIHTPKLQALHCSDCPLLALDLIYTPHLKMLNCDRCPIPNLDLSHTPLLQTLFCGSSPMMTLDLTHNPLLEGLYLSFCPNLTALDLSQTAHLKELSCNNCQNLTSLGSSMSTILKKIDCRDCPKLTELPQVPPAATVLSRGSPCGDLKSFNVHPEVLEKNPKQVLLDLGKILLKNNPMPNIVFIDPATGEPFENTGERDKALQLVETLCQNLFQKDSNFTFIKDGDYDLPTLNTPGDLDALRTFARLLGLAAISGYITGTKLHPSFFYSLFSLTDQEIAAIPYDQALPEPLKKKLHMARQELFSLDFNHIEMAHMEKESNVLTAMAVVAKELHTLLGARFRKFESNIEKFIADVQGVQITKERLKEHILCKNDTYKKWIDNFVDTLPSGYEPKHLVQLLTGSYYLRDEIIIFEVDLDKKHLESSSVIFTCFKSMILPGDLSEEALHEELKGHLSLMKGFDTPYKFE